MLNRISSSILFSYFSLTLIEITLKKVLCLMLNLDEEKNIGIFMS